MNHVEVLVTPRGLRPYLAHKADLLVQDILSNQVSHSVFTGALAEPVRSWPLIVHLYYRTCIRLVSAIGETRNMGLHRPVLNRGRAYRNAYTTCERALCRLPDKLSFEN